MRSYSPHQGNIVVVVVCVCTRIWKSGVRVCGNDFLPPLLISKNQAQIASIVGMHFTTWASSSALEMICEQKPEGWVIITWTSSIISGWNSRDQCLEAVKILSCYKRQLRFCLATRAKAAPWGEKQSVGQRWRRMGKPKHMRSWGSSVE